MQSVLAWPYVSPYFNNACSLRHYTTHISFWNFLIWSQRIWFNFRTKYLQGCGQLIYLFIYRFIGFYQGTIMGVGSPKFVRLAFVKVIFWTRIPKGWIKMHNGNMLGNIMTKIWRFNTIILTMTFPWSLKNAPTLKYCKIPNDFK